MLRCAVAHVGTLLPQPPRAWKNLEADDGRRKSLADKGCCRRSVVVQAVGGGRSAGGVQPREGAWARGLRFGRGGCTRVGESQFTVGGK